MLLIATCAMFLITTRAPYFGPRLCNLSYIYQSPLLFLFHLSYLQHLSLVAEAINPHSSLKPSSVVWPFVTLFILCPIEHTSTDLSIIPGCTNILQSFCPTYSPYPNWSSFLLGDWYWNGGIQKSLPWTHWYNCQSQILDNRYPKCLLDSNQQRPWIRWCARVAGLWCWMDLYPYFIVSSISNMSHGGLWCWHRTKKLHDRKLLLQKFDLSDLRKNKGFNTRESLSFWAIWAPMAEAGPHNSCSRSRWTVQFTCLDHGPSGSTRLTTWGTM